MSIDTASPSCREPENEKNTCSTELSEFIKKPQNHGLIMNFICTEESVNILNRLYGSAVIVVVWLRDIEFVFVVCSVVH